MGGGQGHSLVTLSIGEEMGREQQRWVVDKVALLSGFSELYRRQPKVSSKSTR